MKEFMPCLKTPPCVMGSVLLVFFILIFGVFGENAESVENTENILIAEFPSPLVGQDDPETFNQSQTNMTSSHDVIHHGSSELWKRHFIDGENISTTEGPQNYSENTNISYQSTTKTTKPGGNISTMTSSHSTSDYVTPDGKSTPTPKEKATVVSLDEGAAPTSSPAPSSEAVKVKEEPTEAPKADCPSSLQNLQLIQERTLIWEKFGNKEPLREFQVSMEKKNSAGCGKRILEYSVNPDVPYFLIPPSLSGEWIITLKGILLKNSPGHCSQKAKSIFASFGTIPKEIVNLTASASLKNVTLRWSIPNSWKLSCDVTAFVIKRTRLDGGVNRLELTEELPNSKDVDYVYNTGNDLIPDTSYAFEVTAVFNPTSLKSLTSIKRVTTLQRCPEEVEIVKLSVNKRKLRVKIKKEDKTVTHFFISKSIVDTQNCQLSLDNKTEVFSLTSKAPGQPSYETISIPLFNPFAPAEVCVRASNQRPTSECPNQACSVFEPKNEGLVKELKVVEVGEKYFSLKWSVSTDWANTCEIREFEIDISQSTKPQPRTSQRIRTRCSSLECSFTTKPELEPYTNYTIKVGAILKRGQNVELHSQTTEVTLETCPKMVENVAFTPVFWKHLLKVTWTDKNSNVDYMLTMDVLNKTNPSYPSCLISDNSTKTEISVNKRSEFKYDNPFVSYEICIQPRNSRNISDCKSKKCLPFPHQKIVDSSVDDLVGTPSETSVFLSWRIPETWYRWCEVKHFTVSTDNLKEKEIWGCTSGQNCSHNLRSLKPNTEYKIKVYATFLSGIESSPKSITLRTLPCSLQVNDIHLKPGANDASMTVSWSDNNTRFVEAYGWFMTPYNTANFCREIAFETTSGRVSDKSMVFENWVPFVNWTTCIKPLIRSDVTKCVIKTCKHVYPQKTLTDTVQNLHATASETSVFITWDLPKDWGQWCDVTGFTATVANHTKTYVNIGKNACTGFSCSFNFKRLVQNTKYTIEIFAKFGKDRRSKSASITITTLIHCPKEVKRISISEEEGNRSVKVTWTDENSADVDYIIVSKQLSPTTWFSRSFLHTEEGFCKALPKTPQRTETTDREAIFDNWNPYAQTEICVQPINGRDVSHCQNLKCYTFTPRKRISKNVKAHSVVSNESSVTLRWLIPEDWAQWCDIANFTSSILSDVEEMRVIPREDCQNLSCSTTFGFLQEDTEYHVVVFATFVTGSVSDIIHISVRTLLKYPDGSYDALTTTDDEVIFLKYSFEDSPTKHVTGCIIQVMELESGREYNFSCYDNVGVINNSKLETGKDYRVQYVVCNARGCAESLRSLTVSTPPKKPQINGTFELLSSSEEEVRLRLPSTGKYSCGSIYLLVSKVKNSLTIPETINLIKSSTSKGHKNCGRNKRSISEDRHAVVARILPLQTDEITLEKSSIEEIMESDEVSKLYVSGVYKFTSGQYEKYEATKFVGPFSFRQPVDVIAISITVPFITVFTIAIIVAFLLLQRTKKNETIETSELIEGGQQLSPNSSFSSKESTTLQPNGSAPGKIRILQPLNDLSVIYKGGKTSKENMQTTPPRGIRAKPDYLTAIPEISTGMEMAPLVPSPVNEIYVGERDVDEGEILYTNVEVPSLQLRESLEKFLISSAHSDAIDDEFRIIPVVAAGKRTSEGMKIQNRRKNRYQNNLPYDDTRVILPKLADDGSSDYINANWVQISVGERREPAWYILTQGPLRKSDTISDFWRMVWYNKVAAVVMLTNLIENGKVKCDQYWPEKGSVMKCKDDISVETTFLEQKKFFVIRSFVVSRGGEDRTVIHYHYTDWPDHGVPEESSPLARMICLLREKHPYGPTVVHCSAGIGRTGVVLLVIKCLEEEEGSNTLDIKQSLVQLRQARSKLVQNAQQYRFSHYLLWVILFEFRETYPALDFDSQLAGLLGASNVGDFDNSSPLLSQYNRIKNYKRNLTFNTAMQPSIRKEYNRFHNIFPADNRLVSLINVSGEIKDKYVNAIMVDGYNKKDAYIVTEHPTRAVAGRVWIMIMERQLPIWVLLNEVDAKNETFQPLVPEDGAPLRFDYLTVKLLKKVCHEFYEENFVRISAEVQGEQALFFECRVVQLLSWVFPEIFPRSGPDCLFALLDYLRGAEPHLTPLLVTCSDGCTASGFTIAFDIACQRADNLQEVKIFDTCVNLTYARPEFIGSPEQYILLYEYLSAYLLCQQQEVYEGFDE